MGKNKESRCLETIWSLTNRVSNTHGSYTMGTPTLCPFFKLLKIFTVVKISEVGKTVQGWEYVARRECSAPNFLFTPLAKISKEHKHQDFSLHFWDIMHFSCTWVPDPQTENGGPFFKKCLKRNFRFIKILKKKKKEMLSMWLSK